MSNYTGTFVPSTDNNPWNKAFDLVEKGSTVLDVGCSTGNFGAALIEHKGCVVDGIEPDAGDYKEAASRLRVVANGFADKALLSIFKDQKYDHIVFLDVIEHLYDPVATLELAKKHLNENGTIVFSMPNMAHASVRLMLLRGDFDYGETGLLDKTHLHFYNLLEIERVFAEAGFSISILDNTEASYPIGLIADQLNELGIKNTPKLEALLNEDSARVFQYVGAATVSKVRKIPRKQFSPDAQGTISLWYQKHLDERDRNLKNLSLRIDQQKLQITQLQRDVENHRTQLQNIKLSRAYKLGSLAAKPYNKSRSILGRIRNEK